MDFFLIYFLKKSYVGLQEWYCLAKLMAEKMAWEYAMTHGINLVTILPGVTIGTMLQPVVNQSSTHILKYLNGTQYRSQSTDCVCFF